MNNFIECKSKLIELNSSPKRYINANMIECVEVGYPPYAREGMVIIHTTSGNEYFSEESFEEFMNKYEK